MFFVPTLQSVYITLAGLPVLSSMAPVVESVTESLINMTPLKPSPEEVRGAMICFCVSVLYFWALTPFYQRYHVCTNMMRCFDGTLAPLAGPKLDRHPTSLVCSGFHRQLTHVARVSLRCDFTSTTATTMGRRYARGRKEKTKSGGLQKVDIICRRHHPLRLLGWEDDVAVVPFAQKLRKRSNGHVCAVEILLY